MKTKRFHVLVLVLRVLVVFALICVGVWVFRAPLAEALLRHQLAEMGIPNTQIKVKTLNPWRAEFENLRLADHASLRQVVAEFEWSGMFSPRLVRLIATGLKLELGDSQSGLDWPALAPLIKKNMVGKPKLNAKRFSDLPEIEIRDTSVQIHGPNGPAVAHMVATSLSLVPKRERRDEEAEAEFKFAADVKADLMLSNLAVDGWEMKDGAVGIAGQIELRNGQLYYQPESCDRVSVKTLKKDNIVFFGPMSVCLKPSGLGSAVSVDHAGKVALDIVAEAESNMFSLDIAALPSIRVETDGASVLVRLSQLPNGRPAAGLALRGLNVVMPATGIALEGFEFSAKTKVAEESPDTWSFEFDAQALRHLAPLPAIRPLRIEGKGDWTSGALTVDAMLRQSTFGLVGAFHLHRDNSSGEGEAEIDFPPLEFREGGIGVGDLSPLLARYVGHLRGGIQATGKISFNDAWATPVEIAGSFEDFVVGVNPSLLPPGMGELTADFGQSRFKVSLPPASPHMSRANVKVEGGGLRLQSTEVHSLTGTININSFSPLTCERSQMPSVAEVDADETATKIVACIQGALSRHVETEKAMARLHDTMSGLHRFLLMLRR